MKLQTVHVTNFRSAEDSEVFEIGQVTCLVGKNESGKSAILLALAALNPHDATPVMLDKERDYPRRSLTLYDQKHPADQPAVIITTTWLLNSTEMALLSEIVGKDVLKDDIIKASRAYGQGIKIEVSLDPKAALELLYSKFELDEFERSVLGDVADTDALLAILSILNQPSIKHQQLEQYLAQGNDFTSQVRSFVLSRLPKFMYFASFDHMDGAVQLERTKELIADGSIDKDEHRGIRLFTEFLSYAGVSIDEITDVNTYESFNAKLQAASNNITDQIVEYWTQNPDLDVTVRIEQARTGDVEPYNTGTIARARIYNSLHRVDTPFAARSAGFVWFFSFLVKFAQVKNDASPVVLLLDEPGLTLHGRAQRDLLRFFKEKLAPHHQMIYSTHSPFMVPVDDLASVRIVEDQVETRGPRRSPLGTKVKGDVLTRDPDTLFPLQGALGYELTRSLFIGEDTLLVGGPGDVLYIQALSDALGRRGRAGLDPRWRVCPAGGTEKLKPFVTLFGKSARHIAVLSTHAVRDERNGEGAKQSAVLRAGESYTVADFLGRAEADIEDIFDPDLFASILNACFDLPESDKLTVDKLKEADGSTERLVKQAEAAFKMMRQAIRPFDRFSPAAWLIRNSALLDADSPSISTTLDRAETIFQTFNRLL